MSYDSDDSMILSTVSAIITNTLWYGMCRVIEIFVLQLTSFSVVDISNDYENNQRNPWPNINLFVPTHASFFSQSYTRYDIQRTAHRDIFL